MQFRWAIGITLWTMLSGPIFAPPQATLRSSPSRSEGAGQSVTHVQPAPGRVIQPR